jgi:hypothetical protein
MNITYKSQKLDQAIEPPLIASQSVGYGLIVSKNMLVFLIQIKMKLKCRLRTLQIFISKKKLCLTLLNFMRVITHQNNWLLQSIA